MARKRKPFDIRVNRIAATDPEDLILGPIKPGRLYSVQWIAVENVTTAYTSLRILKTTPGAEHFFLEEISPLAGRLYWNDTPIFLQELETLICRLAGATANDVINAYFSGWWIDVRGGV